MDIEEPKKNQGGRPRKDITKTPEFKEAVAAAMAEAIPQIVSAVRGAQPLDAMEPAGSATDGDQDVINRMALAIGDIANQSSGRKVVDPKELERRAKGRAKMIAVLQRVHEQGLVPEYKLTSETYLNDAMLKPFENDASGAIRQVEIEWDGIPNEAMSPNNEIAEEIYDAFLQSIGGFTDATKNARNDPYWVTKNGLTVKGRGNTRRTVGSMGDSNHPNVPADDGAPVFQSRVAKKNATQNDPRANEVAVLGTIAPRARQNGSGVQAGR